MNTCKTEQLQSHDYGPTNHVSKEASSPPPAASYDAPDFKVNICCIDIAYLWGAYSRSAHVCRAARVKSSRFSRSDKHLSSSGRREQVPPFRLKSGFLEEEEALLSLYRIQRNFVGSIFGVVVVAAATQASGASKESAVFQ